MEGRASDKETTCVVCVSHSQDAVLLPCDHSVCPKCCDALRAAGEGEGQLDCPRCGKKDISNPSPEPRADLSNPTQQRQPDQFAADSAPAAHLTPAGDPQEANKHDAPIEAATELTGRQCPEHKEALEFYCEDDGDCVCGPCTITGRHKSHTLMSLDKAQAEIKEKLRKEVENLRIVQQDCHFKHQDLEITQSEVKTQIDQLKGNLSKKFSEWRKSLEGDEEYALKMIEEEGLQVLTQSTKCSDALNKRMNLIRLIDDETQDLVQRDPLSFIQHSKQLLYKVVESQNQPDPDIPNLTLNLYSAPQRIKNRMNNSFTYQSAILGTTNQWSVLTLDSDTAYWLLNVSDDEKTVMFGYMGENSWHNSKMFENVHQILCSQSFTAGCHSWDLKTGGISWGVGVAYGSIDRGGLGSFFTNSSKSWCLYFYRGSLTACHKFQHTYLLEYPAISRIRVQLDYEAGTVSFYQVKDLQRHLHTFQTTFTEPVFPAFSCSGNSSLKLS
ncbi:E3 ubiquitin-protein ligase TRIM7-like [Heptranchias perlo]|uniref:E3 ubiquitin-protein ligase TRIM7-like n=1 Tax=Heptranchias perlo TaxID=212740 RepID=UPI00355985BC